LSLATNIVRRSGSSRYYVRQRVPVDLVATYGKAEIWRSLGTTDQREAKRLARSVLDELDREFEAKRTAGTFTEHDLQEAIWNRYVELTEADETSRRLGELSDAELDDVWQHLRREFGDYDLNAFRIFEYIRDRFEIEQRERPARLATLKAGVARGDLGAVERDIAAVAKERSAPIPKGSDLYRKLGHGLQRAELEALARAEERDAGDFTGSPRDSLIQPPKVRLVAPTGETIMSLFDTYAAENPENVRADTLNQSRMAVELFVDHVGARFPASSIGKPQVRTWKALLLKYPVKAAETKIFAGMALKDIVATNDALPPVQRKPAISPKTVNRYLAGLSAFVKWLVASGYLQTNPLTDMFISVDKAKGSKATFTTTELQSLFGSPLFGSCQSDEKMHLPGNHKIRDHRYWLPLVMLWSGARPAEIAQLLVADVREQHGTWIMHVTEEGDDEKSTKTKGSMRVVPIHSELTRLGFVEFVKAQAAKGEKRLFPEAERNSRGQMAAKFSRDFGRYLDRVDIKDGRGLSLYSFRHGFIDALRRAEFLDDQFAMIIGHAKHTTTGRYGHIPEGMLRQRVEMVEAVSFPGLDLSHLYPDKTS